MWQTVLLPLSYQQVSHGRHGDPGGQARPVVAVRRLLHGGGAEGAVGGAGQAVVALVPKKEVKKMKCGNSTTFLVFAFPQQRREARLREKSRGEEKAYLSP